MHIYQLSDLIILSSYITFITGIIILIFIISLIVFEANKKYRPLLLILCLSVTLFSTYVNADNHIVLNYVITGAIWSGYRYLEYINYPVFTWQVIKKILFWIICWPVNILHYFVKWCMNKHMLNKSIQDIKDTYNVDDVKYNIDSPRHNNDNLIALLEQAPKEAKQKDI